MKTAKEIYNEFMNKDYLGVRVTTEDRIIHAMEAYKLQTIKQTQEELRKQYMDVIYENGYPIKAVPQATIEGLVPLMCVGAK
jgi:hypothetical protein